MLYLQYSVLLSALYVGTFLHHPHPSQAEGTVNYVYSHVCVQCHVLSIFSVISVFITAVHVQSALVFRVP